MPDDDIQNLVSAVYEAALEAELWPAVLPRLLRALGSQRGLIGLATSGRPDIEVDVGVDLDPELMGRWVSEFGKRDVFFDTYGRQLLSAGMAFRVFDVVPADEVRRTDVFRAIYTPGGIDDCLATFLSKTGSRGSFLAAYRSAKEQPFGADECKLHQLLSPHLVMAARIHDRLHVLGSQIELREAVIERLPFALFWLDATGRVLAMNGAAERLLARRDGLVTRCTVLGAAVCEEQRELERAIASAAAVASRRGPGAASFVRIARTTPGQAYTALVAPIPPRTRDVVFGFEPRAPAVVVAVSDPTASPPVAEESLRRLFRLPPALARLAVAIANGKTIAEYAEEAEVTMGTVRQQMKELLARTGARRQAELVRTILTSVAQLEP